jgi:hypothetical protein
MRSAEVVLAPLQKKKKKKKKKKQKIKEHKIQYK